MAATAETEPQALPQIVVRRLAGPALLTDPAGHLCVWDGRTFTDRYGTPINADAEGPWTLVSVPVTNLRGIAGAKGTGVDGYRLRVLINTGRDPYYDGGVR